MSKKKKKKLNPKILEKHTTEMAMAALTGQPIPSTSVNLNVDIPNPMLAIAQHYADVSGEEINVILSQMVKEGLSYRIKSISEEATGKSQTTEDDPLVDLPEMKRLQEALGGFESNMGNFAGLVDTLNKLAESVNAITPDGDILKDG